jgi:hypothetical protein
VTIGPISRTRHDVPDFDRSWRQGPTSHEESGIDVADYVQALERAHLLALHGSGIAAGLAVSADVGDTRIRIGPGVAVDAEGRHLVLAPGTLVEVSANPATNSLLLPMPAAGLGLSTQGKKGRCTVYAVWRETLDKALAFPPPPTPARFVQRHTPWIRLVAEGDAVPPTGVELGSVELDPTGIVLPDGLSPSGRTGPQPAARTFRVSRTQLDVTQNTASVAEVDAGLLAADDTDGVRLESGATRLSVRPGRVSVRSGDTAHLTVDTTTGRVGVGTTEPTHPVHVAATRGIRQGELYVSGRMPGPSATSGWNSISYNAHHNDTNSGWVFPDPARPAVTVEMDDFNGTPRFEVFSTTPGATQAWRSLLRVNGSTGAVQAGEGPIVPKVGDSTNAGIQFPQDPGGGAGDSAYIRYKVEGGETTALVIGCENDADDRIVLRQSNRETLVLAGGRVGVSTRDPQFDLQVNGTACATQFCNPSDARLKADVRSLTAVLDRLADVRGVSFRDRTGTDRRRLGVVAQDVETTFPELVVPMADDGLMAVDYSGLVGVLVTAVNELRARTERLTREVASLRAAAESPA